MDDNTHKPVQTKMNKAFAEYVKTCCDADLLKLLEETDLYKFRKFSGTVVVDPERIFHLIPNDWHKEEEFRREAEKKLVCPTPSSRDYRSNKKTDKKSDDGNICKVQKRNGGIFSAISALWRKLLSSDSGERGSYDKQETIRGHYKR